MLWSVLVRLLAVDCSSVYSQGPEDESDLTVTEVLVHVASTELSSLIAIDPLAEQHIVRIQAAMRGKYARIPPGIPSDSDEYDDGSDDDSDDDLTPVARSAPVRPPGLPPVPAAAAASTAAAVLPAGWDVQVSQRTGEIYYVNVVTTESSYDLPTQSVLPAGWTHETSATSGKTYYVDPQVRPKPASFCS